MKTKQNIERMKLILEMRTAAFTNAMRDERSTNEEIGALEIRMIEAHRAVQAAA